MGRVHLNAGDQTVAAWGRARSDLVPWKTGQAGPVPTPKASVMGEEALRGETNRKLAPKAAHTHVSPATSNQIPKQSSEKGRLLQRDYNELAEIIAN